MVWQEMQIVQILCACTGSYKILDCNSEYYYLQEEYKKRKKSVKEKMAFLYLSLCL